MGGDDELVDKLPYESPFDIRTIGCIAICGKTKKDVSSGAVHRRDL